MWRGGSNVTVENPKIMSVLRKNSQNVILPSLVGELRYEGALGKTALAAPMRLRS